VRCTNGTCADTLERNILDLAARQGLSLYTKENCTGTVSVEAFADAAHPAGPEPAPRARKPVGTKGDFVFRCVLS
jgi:E3 ubiquitin-protein ligase SHPRH